MPQSNWTSLWNAITRARTLSDCCLLGADRIVPLADLVRGSYLGGRAEELRGRCVLVSTADQIAAATSLIELDGIARRLVLCPSDLRIEHLSAVIDLADVDAIVTDRATMELNFPGVRCYLVSPEIVPADYDRTIQCQTEWILLTSGTTGLPKLVAHTLESLAGAIQSGVEPPSPVIWSTFYDIRRYGGLQIFLRAVLTGSTMVLSGTQESPTDFLIRAGACQVTHISGTPSHWRRALMSPSALVISPQYIRLSGEIADQAILNHLQSAYPKANIAHAFASTEAGVAFDVTDGLAGFPARLIGERADVALKVEDGSLRIRSTRIGDRYLGGNVEPIRGADGFVDTGDMLELRSDRYYFVGRRDGTINVGGLKVHPEEVEAVINRHPQVRMSIVRSRRNPITGAVVVAEVVLRTASESSASTGQLQQDILLFCRKALPSHKVPAAIKFVPAVAVAETGKILRYHA
jgi:acyl-coenzyme A synthetase/AMP-(fatty) acid ligase